MVGIFPILGISATLLGQNLDLLGIPKTCKSVGILHLGDWLCNYGIFLPCFRHIQPHLDMQLPMPSQLANWLKIFYISVYFTIQIQAWNACMEQKSSYKVWWGKFCHGSWVVHWLSQVSGLEEGGKLKHAGTFFHLPVARGCFNPHG